MKKAITAGALAIGGLMTLGVGAAHAGEIQVEGNYATLAACQTDGPEVEITRDNNLYSHWDCRQGADGLYYLWLSS